MHILIDEYQELINKMIEYQTAYDEGHPLISDKEWDDMYFHLIKIEKTLGCASVYSPTQRIDYRVVNELQKVEHNHPMLSLDK